MPKRRRSNINQFLKVKLTCIDRISFPIQSGQPVFGLTGNSKFNLTSLIQNSQYATFGTLFGLYKLTGVAIEVIGQGTSANYDYPCAVACFPSGTGNLVISWTTIRAGDMNIMLNPNGRVRKYFRLGSNPYRQVDQIPEDTFLIAVGSQANSTQEALITYNIKIDVYFRFKQLKI